MIDPQLTQDLPRLAALVARLYADLDLLDYYHLLGVGRRATPVEVRDAFHDRARALHPDRFFSLTDPALKERLSTVYKRVAEAYRVLSNSDRRAAYDEQLRAGRLRLAPQESSPPEAAPGPAAPAPPAAAGGASGRSIPDANARQFYDHGSRAMDQSDFRQAVTYLEQAQSLAPGNPRVEAKLAEARRLLKLWGG